MNEQQIARMAKWKLLGHNSCADCKFLYLQDSGFSNWTVEETDEGADREGSEVQAAE